MNWKYYQPTFEHRNIFPDYDGPWFGHKFFTYDFVANTKPQKIVELGTWKGTSFFSFCQAVKDFKLNTELIAIDTWKGDKHSGLYEEDIYELFNKVKKEIYSGLNITILRKLFDDAIKDIPDNSIDLLHIDGLHTYDAVKHDFDTWINKVKDDGVIFFHDTHEKSSDFGVYKLWKELKNEYQTMEYSHSHGLGVLFKDKEKYKSLLSFQDVWQQYYSVVPENKIIKNDNSIKESTISELNQSVQQKESEVLNLNESLQEKELNIKGLNQDIKQGKEENNNLEKSINQKESTISELNQSVQQEKSEVLGLNQSLQEKEENLQNLNQEIRHGKDKNDKLEIVISQNKSAISELNQFVQQKEENIKNLIHENDIINNKFKEKTESLDYILNRCISFKIGMILTAPLRFLYEAYKKIKN